jgi:Caspase domain
VNARRWLPLALIAGAMLPAVAARAETAMFTLAIGYNGLPPDAGADSRLSTLRFADDDAARVFALGRQLSRSAHLLTLLDRDTAARRPELTALVRPPTLAELRRTVAELQRAIEAADREGLETAVLLFYSGHGTLKPDGRGTLTLHDGELTQQVLYDEVLAKLPARFVHLLVDACHAEATVRPRDAQAQVVDVPPADAAAYVNRATLARFAGVGAIVASSSDARTHEWDVYQGGVFTHEILSGLRGGADVDGDRRIEYSEMAAFLAAANRSIQAPQARPRTLVHAPPANPRAALVALTRPRQAAWLEGRPGDLGAFHVEDERGERLADLRAERSYRVALLLPSEVSLYVRTAGAEAPIRLREGERLDFAALPFSPAELRSRGALESALRRGLFATAFGPAYYQGYVDNQSELVPVHLADEAPAAQLNLTAPPPAPAARRSWPALTALGVSAALTVTAGSFGVLAWKARSDYQSTNLERSADLARERFQDRRTAAMIAGSGAVISGGVGLLLWWLDRPAAAP